jgi:hypothetical protein
MMIFVTGLIGVIIYAAFLGFMLLWVPAPPLIIIVLIVTSLLLYDWIQALRFGDDAAGRR